MKDRIWTSDDPDVSSGSSFWMSCHLPEKTFTFPHIKRNRLTAGNNKPSAVQHKLLIPVGTLLWRSGGAKHWEHWHQIYCTFLWWWLQGWHIEQHCYINKTCGDIIHFLIWSLFSWNEQLLELTAMLDRHPIIASDLRQNTHDCGWKKDRDTFFAAEKSSGMNF